MSITPNWGRNPAIAGNVRPAPTSMDFRYPDQDRVVALYLQITNLAHFNVPRENWPWTLCWEIGTYSDPTPGNGYLWVYRSMELVKENSHPWFTFWGPMTRTMLAGQRPADNDPSRIHLANLSLQARQVLEQVAFETPIFDPSPNWNQQNWIVNVLQRAIHAGVLPPQIMQLVPTPTLPLP